MSAANLTVILGPMSSGKTTSLLIEATKYADLGYKVIYITHLSDTRTDMDGGDGASFTSHSSSLRHMSDKIAKTKVACLKDADVSPFCLVCVDEGNFYPDLVETIKVWLEDGRIIVVVGLDGDYKMEPFGEILRLLPIADNFYKLRGVCRSCSRTGELTPPAPFSKRLHGDLSVTVAGSSTYQASCRYHHSVPPSVTVISQVSP